MRFDAPPAAEPLVKYGRLRTPSLGPSAVVFEDGPPLEISYELLDACGAQDGDRVRVTRTDGVTKVAPLLSLTEAIAVLVRFGVLPADGAVEVGNDSADMPWPLELFERVWGADGTNEAVIAFEHDDLSIDDVAIWLRRSDLATATVTAGPPARDGSPTVAIGAGSRRSRPARLVAHEVGPELHELLEDLDAPWRWYWVHSWDSRAAFPRTFVPPPSPRRRSPGNVLPSPVTSEAKPEQLCFCRVTSEAKPGQLYSPPRRLGGDA